MKKLKLVFCIATALLCMVLLLCACETDNGNTPTDTTPTSGFGTTTPEPETTAPAPELVTVIENGETEYALLRGQDVNDAQQKLFSQFFAELKQRTGCEIKFTEALERVEIDPDAKEILLGDTNRPESIALFDKLVAAGGNRFGISMTGTKLAVTGTSIYQTYLGLDYFFNNCVNSEGAVIVEQGFEYISDSSDVKNWTLDMLLEQGIKPSFVGTDELFKISPQKGFSVMQGGGTDGKYAYIALICKALTPEQGKIFKFDLETKELVKVSEGLLTAHTNDITYDSKNHRLVISRCTEEDGWRGVSFVDPDTLELIETIMIPTGFRAIDYLPTTNQYVLGINYSFVITDENFNTVSSFPCQDPQYTTQGCYSDEKYIYDVRYISKSDVHYIVIYTMDGQYIGTVPVYGFPNVEPENLFFYNGDFIMGCNKASRVYKLELVPENYWGE